MRKNSLNSSSYTKGLACLLTSLSVAALLFLLPQTQQALPLGARSARHAAMFLRPAAMLLHGARDFWHTEGNRILDADDHSVRISGMNWSGFETKQAVPGGLEAQDYRAILRTIKQSGYNTVRIPFSNEMIEMPVVPERVSFSNAQGPINTELRDLNSLEILDKIVTYSGKIGLKIILDNHRSEAGSSAQESGLWYTSQYPEAAWIQDWTALAHRYQSTSTVIGMDLRNEPHNAEKGGACWDCGGTNDWHSAATRAGNAILTVNPRLLIFVEGVDTYAGDTYWWGGNLEGVRRSPVRLSVPNRLVYSAHEYGPTEYPQPWFNVSMTPAGLADIWHRHWAYISEAGIAPVWIGEFGTPNSDSDVQSSIPGSEGQWFISLVEYLGSHPSLGWTYWGVNGDDRYGLLDAAYSNLPVNQQKAQALASISHDVTNETSDLAVAAVSTSLSAYRRYSPTTFAQSAVVPLAGPIAPNRAAVDKSHRIARYRVTQAPSIPAPVTSSDYQATKSTFDPLVQSAITASVHQAVSNANLKLACNS